MGTPRTLYGKVWDRHVVDPGTADLLYVDVHLVHEATSAQAFAGLAEAEPRRGVRRPDLTLAVEDHNVPTDSLTVRDPVTLLQVGTLRQNCATHGIELYPHGHDRQGIVHVVGPELGIVQPGMSVVCGDSHTSTHGAFGALAFGVGTSDVEHVLATQTLALARAKTMAVEFVGVPPRGVQAKDLMLALLAEIGANGARGYAVEYRGEAIRNSSMEARMTICNLSIEAGARVGMIAPDEVTYEYLRDRPYAPVGDDWDAAVADWESLRTDDDATFDRVVHVDVSSLTPFVTWGTNPSQAVPLAEAVPHPDDFPDAEDRRAAERALEYMDLTPGTKMRDILVDVVFLGSCTNGRIEDLRQAAEVLRGRKIAAGVRMLVVPGSMTVRRQAEEEGLGKVFHDAGAEWRLAGCSMCLGMNPDRLAGAQRCASTSNRNYEGRQGTHARTHLVSPAVAAATAVAGHLAVPADLD
ncbi:3-isopropylmalate dehydratase large subunit [Saccharothrix sp. ALI-22-I]|uniref:3-isopropylmalate dehydratase large subunit n=1 Tax=Saccharothrix sp. ALI-22-I TaxID=1933778 RepID=UPI00097BFED7|nr:3-isopropylmalate dehydratase large subunit [Saccharothrix sp. ALI-22-I]ONI88795.1 3-isopropylmalate dehydratase large subunit [Saccharothrix sp. ALI-22-I]